MKETIHGILVEITRKNIKTLRITVMRKDCSVKVSAPVSLSDKRIASFIKEKKNWITAQQQKFLQMPEQKEESFAEDTLFLWGQQYNTIKKWDLKTEYRLKDGTIILYKSFFDLDEELECALDNFYKIQLQKRIQSRLPVMEALTGLKCSGWRIRKMVSRWGSCNTKTRALCFNLNLAKKPYECLDYVIIHELIHIAVPNHGADFKALLNRHCPSWQAVKKVMNS
ncbi:MAG: SprT family zinc-dependent metalloprotease [Clostridia bacterium]|nr:SprT family zinc-dependent metalloprotease [Clostridia bacterium]